MCLNTTETEAKIAKKDITVYKEIRQISGTNAFWRAVIRGTVHSFNKILKGTDRLHFIPSPIWNYRIEEGFHAFTKIYLKPYKFGILDTFFAKAIIPQGSEYAKGNQFSLNEIVANNMIVFSSNWQYFLWKLGFRKRFK